MRANYKLQRLFVDVPPSAGATIAADAKPANYLRNVLRMTDGAALLIFNGRDGEWRARVALSGKRDVSLTAERLERPQPPTPDLIYAFAPLKAGRLDYMVQKAVEMGAGVLQPVLTQHTQVSRLNIDKVRANALEAAEQCGLLAIPECRAPLKFDVFLTQWDADRALVFCDEDHDSNNPMPRLATLKGRSEAPMTGP